MVTNFRTLVGPNLFVMVPPPLYTGAPHRRCSAAAPGAAPLNSCSTSSQLSSAGAEHPDWHMNQTLINRVFPALFQTLFADLGIPADHVINLFVRGPATCCVALRAVRTVTTD